MNRKTDHTMLPGRLNKKIGRALHDWDMLSDGDRVLVAVSGGIDSLVAAWVLQVWRAKAPIDYMLEAVYVDSGFEVHPDDQQTVASRIGECMHRLEIPFSVIKAPPHEGETRTCYICARRRRTQLFKLAKSRGCSKIAFGHHKDDLVETFFLNVLYSGNISTMRPRQDLFDGKLSLIRVLSYLIKDEVCDIARIAGISAIAHRCEHAGNARRETIREILDAVYGRVPDARSSVFNALGNVRDEYML